MCIYNPSANKQNTLESNGFLTTMKEKLCGSDMLYIHHSSLYTMS